MQFNGIDGESRWEAISDQLGGSKSAAEVELQYRKVIFDVESIEEYIVPPPPIINGGPSNAVEHNTGVSGVGKKTGSLNNV